MPRTVNPVKLEARRREILDAAQACFVQKGFHATTMAEICAAADISPGGLYRYFPSKEAIIAAMAEDERQLASDAFRQVVAAEDFLGALSALCDHFVEAYAEPRHAALMAELMAEALRNPDFAAAARETQMRLREDVAAMLRTGQAAGHVEPGLDAEQAAGLLIAAADGLGLRMVFLGDFDAAEAGAALRSLILRYLKPDSSLPEPAITPPPPGASNDA
jgi:TetR/AcrR family transcriptional regulator, repressor for uid operon